MVSWLGGEVASAAGLLDDYPLMQIVLFSIGADSHHMSMAKNLTMDIFMFTELVMDL